MRANRTLLGDFSSSSQGKKFAGNQGTTETEKREKSKNININALNRYDFKKLSRRYKEKKKATKTKTHN